MDATRDAKITALERRLAALEAAQKKTLDAILVLGLASAAWDVDDVVDTLRELAADGAGMSESFVNDIARDARVMLRTLS
jgi:hypothetical protein